MKYNGSQLKNLGRAFPEIARDVRGDRSCAARDLLGMAAPAHRAKKRLVAKPMMLNRQICRFSGRSRKTAEQDHG
ncbi:MAG: hypothetical protein HYX37_01665 [Rhizobiales bacterium]|nr:hypothetical protein [Hyphomicrobiales bacterium]